MINVVPNRFDTCLCQEEGARSWSVLKEDYMMGASSMKVMGCTYVLLALVVELFSSCTVP